MKSTLPILLFLTLLGLASCKVGPNYKSPEMDNPDTYRFDESDIDSVEMVGWWEIFDDPQLQDLIRIALAENRDLRAAVARIEEARAFYGFTKADLYPKFDIQAQYSPTNLNPAVTEQTAETLQQFLIAPGFSWEIDFWGKFRRANEAAQAELIASEFARRQIAISLISEVVSTYFLLLDFDNRLEISLRTLDTRRESTRIIQARFDKGRVAELDLNQAQIQEAIAEAAVPLFEREVALLEHTMSILIGRNPGAIVRDETLWDQPLPPQVPSGLPSELLTRRPDVVEAEQLLIAQNARIGVAVAQRFPAISLTGLLGFASTDISKLFTGDGFVWGVSAQLLSPLYNFGKNKRRVEVERFRTEQALNNYEQVVLGAFADVEDALISIRTYGAEYNARQKQVTAARNAVNLSRERYNGGVTSYLEVLEQDRTVFDAELQASQTRQQQLNSYVALYKALGGGWINEAEQQAAQQEGQEE